MFTFFRYIIQLGIHPENNLGFNQRLKNYNIFTLSCALISFAYLLFMLANAYFLFASFFFILVSLFTIVLVLHHYRKYYKSRILVLFSTCFSVFLLGMFFGPNAGFRLYFFVAPLIVFSIFKYNETKQVVLSFLLYIACFSILQYTAFTDYQPVFKITTEFSQLLFNINASFTFIFAIVLTSSISRFYLSFAQRLKSKNNDLMEVQMKLENLVEEKNVLLAETHHRVKNNLAMVSGIFDLQLMTERHPSNIEILKKSQNRIRSMSLVHELLYQHPNIMDIDLAEYTQKLVENIKKSISSVQPIDFICQLDSIPIDLSRAIPLGLIINEVLTNSIKHAFNQMDRGEILIQIRQSDKHFQILIQDNGAGFDVNDEKQSESLGLDLIQALSAQLNAEYSFVNQKGTVFSIQIQNYV